MHNLNDVFLLAKQAYEQTSQLAVNWEKNCSFCDVILMSRDHKGYFTHMDYL